MNPSIGFEQPVELRQDPIDGIIRKVVQKAVHQDHIKSAERGQVGVHQIRLNEPAAVLRPVPFVRMLM